MGIYIYRRSHNGDDLFWKKHMGDQEKPKNRDIGRYFWYSNPKKKL